MKLGRFVFEAIKGLFSIIFGGFSGKFLIALFGWLFATFIQIGRYYSGAIEFPSAQNITLWIGIAVVLVILGNIFSVREERQYKEEQYQEAVKEREKKNNAKK